MAVFKGDVLKSFSATVGPVVMYERKGRLVMRSKGVWHDARTPRQLEHRMRFGLASRAVSPLKRVVAFGMAPAGKDLNAVRGEVYRNGIVGSYPQMGVDYSRVRVSEGDVAVPMCVRAKHDKCEGKIFVEWNDEPLTGDAAEGWSDWQATRVIDVPMREPHADDRVSVACMATEHGEVIFERFAARRGDGRCGVSVGQGFAGGDVAVWIIFTDKLKHIHSNSLFVRV
ncbi:MAG: DUF6266 family protein [Fermentimonas sp.]|jgi:hypothetical protein